MRALLAVGWLLAGQVAEEPSGEVPEKIQRFLDESETQRQAAIEIVRAEWVKLAQNRQPRAERAERIARLKKLRDNKALYVPALAARPELEAIGRLQNPNVRIEQVIDEDEVLVTAYWTPQVSGLLGDQTSQTTYWIRGVATAGFADDSGGMLEGCFEVTGNEQYETLDGGSNAVLVLEPFDVATVEEYRQLKPRRGN